MRRRIRAREAAAALLIAFAASGCAKKAPPSGGPPDLEPPRILSTTPDSGAAGVARDAGLTLTFSESMEPRSTGTAVDLAPRIEIRQRRWSGRTLTLVLAETLRTNQVYTLFVGTEARDRHGNALKDGRTVTFTTAATMPPGLIAGKVDGVGFAVSGTALWCYPEGTQPDSTARDFRSLGLADTDGGFRIEGLEPGRYRLWAFADLNRNRSFEPTTDLLAPAETTITLTATAPTATGIALRVVNPRAPGRLQLAVLDTLGNTEGSLRLIVYATKDTLRKLLYEVDARGVLDTKLEPATYVLQAFRDLDKNKIWKRDTEPASDPQTVVVSPGGELKGLTFALKPPAGTANSP